MNFVEYLGLIPPEIEKILGNPEEQGSNTSGKYLELHQDMRLVRKEDIYTLGSGFNLYLPEIISGEKFMENEKGTIGERILWYCANGGTHDLMVEFGRGFLERNLLKTARSGLVYVEMAVGGIDPELERVIFGEDFGAYLDDATLEGIVLSKEEMLKKLMVKIERRYNIALGNHPN